MWERTVRYGSCVASVLRRFDQPRASSPGTRVPGGQGPHPQLDARVVARRRFVGHHDRLFPAVSLRTAVASMARTWVPDSTCSRSGCAQVLAMP